MEYNSLFLPAETVVPLIVIIHCMGRLNRAGTLRREKTSLMTVFCNRSQENDIIVSEFEHFLRYLIADKVSAIWDGKCRDTGTQHCLARIG